jgi:phosphoglycolate phosphatase-like HAD superfamily hydrolase
VTKIALQRASLTFGADVGASKAIVVGDTPHDVESAHWAGLKCLGVGSHKFDVDELRDAGADYVIASLTEKLPF